MPVGTSLILSVCVAVMIALVVVGRSRTRFTASRLVVLGTQCHSQGQHAEAERLFRRALEMRERALGPDHPDVALTRPSRSCAGRSPSVTASIVTKKHETWRLASGGAKQEADQGPRTWVRNVRNGPPTYPRFQKVGGPCRTPVPQVDEPDGSGPRLSYTVRWW